jgi:hypothetical protein
MLNVLYFLIKAVHSGLDNFNFIKEKQFLDFNLEKKSSDVKFKGGANLITQIV